MHVLSFYKQTLSVGTLLRTDIKMLYCMYQPCIGIPYQQWSLFPAHITDKQCVSPSPFSSYEAHNQYDNMIFHGRIVKSKNSRFNSSIFFIVIIPYHAVTISNLNYLDSFSHHCGFSFPVSMTAMKAKTKCIKPKLSTPCLMVVSVVSYPSLQ